MAAPRTDATIISPGSVELSAEETETVVVSATIKCALIASNYSEKNDCKLPFFT